MTNPRALDGKLILITGASSGIGRQTAVVASRLGGRIVAVGRDESRLAETMAALDGDRHTARAFDVDESDAIVPLVQELAAEHGPLDGVVHSAGIQRAKPLRAAKADDYLSHFRTNALAGALLLAAIAKRNVAAPGCSAVLVGSVMSELGAAGLTAYCTSKAAVSGLVRSAALELAPARIRVNAVLPGVVDTEMSRRHLGALGAEHTLAVERMHPLGIGAPDDVAEAVVYLLSDAARWITGTCLKVDGGYSAQ